MTGPPYRARPRAALFLLSTLLPLGAASLPAAKPEEVGLSSERLQRIHEMISRCLLAGGECGVGMTSCPTERQRFTSASAPARDGSFPSLRSASKRRREFSDQKPTL